MREKIKEFLLICLLKIQNKQINKYERERERKNKRVKEKKKKEENFSNLIELYSNEFD